MNNPLKVWAFLCLIIVGVAAGVYKPGGGGSVTQILYTSNALQTQIDGFVSDTNGMPGGAVTNAINGILTVSNPVVLAQAGTTASNVATNAADSVYAAGITSGTNNISGKTLTVTPGSVAGISAAIRGNIGGSQVVLQLQESNNAETVSFDALGNQTNKGRIDAVQMFLNHTSIVSQISAQIAAESGVDPTLYVMSTNGSYRNWVYIGRTGGVELYGAIGATNKGVMLWDTVNNKTLFYSNDTLRAEGGTLNIIGALTVNGSPIAGTGSTNQSTTGFDDTFQGNVTINSNQTVNGTMSVNTFSAGTFTATNTTNLVLRGATRIYSDNADGKTNLVLFTDDIATRGIPIMEIRDIQSGAVLFSIDNTGQLVGNGGGLTNVPGSSTNFVTLNAGTFHNTNNAFIGGNENVAGTLSANALVVTQSLTIATANVTQLNATNTTFGNTNYFPGHVTIASNAVVNGTLTANTIQGTGSGAGTISVNGAVNSLTNHVAVVHATNAITVNGISVVTNTPARMIGVTIDGGGTAITNGHFAGFIEVPYACSIVRATLLADTTGYAWIDVWKTNYANFPPAVAQTITAGLPVPILNAQKGQLTTLTGWTTNIAEGDILAFNVISNTTCTRLTLTLKVQP